MRLTHPRNPAYEEPCEERPAGYYRPPARFTVRGAEGRLVEALRAPLRAHRGDPLGLLVEASLALLGGDAQRGEALADLAVTGRAMYERFRASPPREEALLARARRRTTNPRLRPMASRVLDRAYGVAWALQGFGERDRLGWIAVSAEDDSPHRPVNVPSAPYPQQDLAVEVQPTEHASGHRVITRYALTRPGARPASSVSREEGIRRRQLPPEQRPRLRRDERLLLYVHGHSSRLEECLDLAAPLAGHGFTLVAMDLPCCGYSSMFDHTELADDSHTDTVTRFPLLEFNEQFIIDFVLALEASLGRTLRHQIAGVVGGSLGGNLGLRLAQRKVERLPFLSNIVAWSPASAWTPFTGLTREAGPNTARARMRVDPPPAPERPETRRHYFHQVFEEDHRAVFVYPQPEYWYRDGWPCKRRSIEGARQDRREIYSPAFRRWHWRVALEQLLFSHRTHSRPERIRSRTLLIAGAADDYVWAHIYDATKDLATTLLTTPGARRLMRDTGHSIHNERPRWLAQEIRDFLPPRSPEGRVREEWRPWRSLHTRLTSRPAVGVNEDGRLEVVARGRDERLWHTWQLRPNGPWSSRWSALRRGLGRGDRFGRSIAVATNHDGRLEVFAQLAGPHWVAHVWQRRANSSWSNWDKGNSFSQLIGGAEDGVAAIERVGEEPAQLSTEDGLRLGTPHRWLLVAARRSNGRIHVRGQNSFGWWTNGRDLGEDSPRFVGTPALAYNRDGRLELFARDERGVAHHLWEERTDHWHGRWAPLHGERVTGDLAVALTVDGRLEVFARGARGELVHAWQVRPNGGWQGWASLGGSLARGACPAVALNPWGELQVFVRWSDGSIRYRRQRTLPRWHWDEWQNLGGAAMFDPVVAANANGTLTVFHVGRDEALHYREQDTVLGPPRLDLRFTRLIPWERLMELTTH